MGTNVDLNLKHGDFKSMAEVPKSIRKIARKFIEVRDAMNGKIILRGYAESFDPGAVGTILTLKGALLDSSQRSKVGVLVEECWTYHPEFQTGGIVIWSCVGVEPDELLTIEERGKPN